MSLSPRDWHLTRTVFADPVFGSEQVPITSGLVETADGVKAALKIGNGPAVFIDLVNGSVAIANLRMTLADRYYGGTVSRDFGSGDVG